MEVLTFTRHGEKIIDQLANSGPVRIALRLTNYTQGIFTLAIPEEDTLFVAHHATGATTIKSLDDIERAVTFSGGLAMDDKDALFMIPILELIYLHLFGDSRRYVKVSNKEDSFDDRYVTRNKDGCSSTFCVYVLREPCSTVLEHASEWTTDDSEWMIARRRKGACVLHKNMGPEDWEMLETLNVDKAIVDNLSPGWRK